MSDRSQRKRTYQFGKSRLSIQFGDITESKAASEGRGYSNAAGLFSTTTDAGPLSPRFASRGMRSRPLSICIPIKAKKRFKARVASLRLLVVLDWDSHWTIQEAVDLLRDNNSLATLEAPWAISAQNSISPYR